MYMVKCTYFTIYSEICTFHLINPDIEVNDTGSTYSIKLSSSGIIYSYIMNSLWKSEDSVMNISLLESVRHSNTW